MLASGTDEGADEELGWGEAEGPGEIAAKERVLSKLLAMKFQVVELLDKAVNVLKRLTTCRHAQCHVSHSG